MKGHKMANGKVEFQVTEEQRQVMKDAAKEQGLTLSGWARSTLLRIARGQSQ